MKSSIETLEPTKVKLTIEVEYEELKPHVDAAYKAIASQINVPGFRKGKVPARIIDQRVGWGPVIEQAVNDSLGTFYGQAASENKLRPMGQPQVDVTGIPEKAGQGQLTYTVEVEVRPEIELPDLSALDIVVEAAQATDADLDERLDLLRERFGTLVGVDRPAREGDYVVIDLKAVIGDEEIDTVSGVSYQIGSGNMLEGLDEALTGLSAGETTSFTANLAGGDHAGQQADVTVTATTVKERELPDLDDEFAQLASEFDTLEELTEDLRTQIAQTKVSNQAVAARDMLLDKLLEAVEVPVPMGVIEAEVKRHLESEGKAEDDEHGEEVKEEAITALKRQIVQDTLAEALEVKVAQDELINYMVQASRQYSMEPQEFIQALDKAGQIPAMVAELARSKGQTMALRQVEVKDSEGNVVDLTEFIGSDEQDAAQAAMREAMAAGVTMDADAGVAPAASADEDAATALP